MANAITQRVFYNDICTLQEGAVQLAPLPNEDANEPAINALTPDRYTRWATNSPPSPMNYDIDFPGVTGISINSWGIAGWLAVGTGLLGTVNFYGWTGAAWTLIDSMNSISMYRPYGDFFRALGATYTYTRYRFTFNTTNDFFVSKLCIGNYIDFGDYNQPAMGTVQGYRMSQLVARTMGGNPIVVRPGRTRRYMRFKFVHADEAIHTFIKNVYELRPGPVIIRDIVSAAVMWQALPVIPDMPLEMSFGSPTAYNAEVEFEQLP